MDAETKKMLMEVMNSAYEDDFFTSGLSKVKREYDNAVKGCKCITVILFIICISIILCDYFIF